jgi:hypothetical protein
VSLSRRLVDRIKLLLPPSDGLRQDIASIVAFPRTIKKGSVNVLADLGYLTPP